MLQKLYQRFSTDFECDTAVGVLGVIDRLGTGLDVSADAVVVAGSESFQVVQSVNGDSVFRGIVTNCSGVTGDVTFGDIVGRLGTNQEAVTTKNSVGSKGGTLDGRI